MRIALATSSYSPHVGGVEEHVRNVATALRRRGHEVAVWTVDRDGGFSIRQLDGVPVWDLPAPLPARNVRDVARFAAAAPRAWSHWNRAFRALRPDIIHVHCFGPNGTFATALSAAHRTPLIVSSHGETIADDAGVFDHSRLARTSLQSAIRRSVVVTGCSRVVLADLEERFGLAPNDGTVVANGIALEEPAETPSLGISGPYIAAVGRLQHVKGFDLLVRAFARANLGAGVSLVIGGDGPEAGQLREMAIQNEVADRVILPGRLSREHVAGLMRDAAVVAVPSRFEAFGIAALEAWRAGAPLVVTDRGGPPEFVTHGVDGMLCDPTDIDAFAATLRAVLTNASEATALAQNGSRRVRSFTWDHTASAYDALYAHI
ncbi:glycosyltransferase family 4 protein [Paramicrobacterium agarici]|uniref:D-inositol 3-phosphate glycosyltransferase n=1 Tax=Paramicrobacterium agarici TaxID=630514 RepID=A0A2A9DWY1_9MICO|nr:glycosyltransferase family 4 protein [Microbacterium agarici]PFG30440.1 phosphatidylinositol alpha-mannosyltransferase/glycogen(starch) synthase [Microbacterium agarici]